MKHIKIAAGLAHVNYGRIADLVKEVSDAALIISIQMLPICTIFKI